MIQKRRVHNMNWFYKNCELLNSNSIGGVEAYYYPISSWLFISDMFRFAGKIVTWDSTRLRIDGVGFNWEEWMFEPGEVKE